MGVVAGGVEVAEAVVGLNDAAEFAVARDVETLQFVRRDYEPFRDFICALVLHSRTVIAVP